MPFSSLPLNVLFIYMLVLGSVFILFINGSRCSEVFPALCAILNLLFISMVYLYETFVEDLINRVFSFATKGQRQR